MGVRFGDCAFVPADHAAAGRSPNVTHAQVSRLPGHQTQRTQRFCDWMPGCLAGWLAGWLACWLVWLIGWTGWLAGRLAGWLAGWPAGWLHGWLAGPDNLLRGTPDHLRRGTPDHLQRDDIVHLWCGTPLIRPPLARYPWPWAHCQQPFL